MIGELNDAKQEDLRAWQPERPAEQLIEYKKSIDTAFQEAQIRVKNAPQPKKTEDDSF